MKLFNGMDDNQYWMSIWSMAATALILLITVVGISSYNEDVLIADLVKEGHDPLELACLYNASDKLESTCFLLAQAKAKAYNVPK